jgi:hypothetical protein
MDLPSSKRGTAENAGKLKLYRLERLSNHTTIPTSAFDLSLYILSICLWYYISGWEG